ncbi:MAG: amylo-alpha-1,6-glucosidase [Fibrobacterota bacterium]
MELKLDRNEVLNLEYTLKKEYLVTNGKGGYASSTLLDCHTRKYHGLLVLPLARQGKMFNLLSKLEAMVEIDKKDFNLSTNKYPGVFYPTGHQFVDNIAVKDFPVTTYKIGDMKLVKSVLMPEGGETVLVRYDLAASQKPVVLKLTPLLAYREIHGLSHENMHIRPRAFVDKQGIKVEPYAEMPPLFMHTSVLSHFYPSPTWWKSFEYLKERNRGYPYQEDLFAPGIFEVRLKKGDSVIFRASTAKATGTLEKEWKAAVLACSKAAKPFIKETEPLRTLKTSAAHYLYQTPSGQPGVIAGYHWFREHGRDTFTALAGLTLCRNDNATAFAILKRFAKLEKGGLMPVIIDEAGRPFQYGPVDIPLLYIRAVQQYLALSGDKKGVEKDLLKTLVAILTAFLDGKVPHAGVRADGLLYAGDASTRLTWMDSVAYDRPVTPRNGAAVEINALWYNALRFLAEQFGARLDKAFLLRIEAAAKSYAASFTDAFWNSAEHCLADRYLGSGNRDTAIRPNQLFAAGLPYVTLTADQIKMVLAAVEEHLVTPFGLRTLSPRDIDYMSEYAGHQSNRDRAAHQGMVWPWLIGIYTDALLKVSDKKAVQKRLASSFSEILENHLSYYGVFQVSEMHTPNPPHIAKGTMGQAANLAEIIRALERVKGSNR